MQVQTPQAESDLGSRGNPSPIFRRIVFDLAFTVLLIGLAIYGAQYLEPTIADQPRQAIDVVLVATLLNVGTILLLSLIERLCPAAGPRKPLRRWLLHIQIYIFSSFLLGLTVALATIAATALAHHFGFALGLIDLRFAGGHGLLALVGASYLYIVIQDFFFYWYHRLQHKSPLLWQQHKLHHIDPELEAVTVLREDWGEAAISALLRTIPLAILFKFDSLDPWQVGVLGGAFVTVFSNLLGLGHMNVRLQAGKASIFYCSPQMHRIHHSLLPQHHDKNFAFAFPLWDVIFGTYYAPARDEFPPTGVDGEEDIQSFWESQTFTVRQWWKMFRTWRYQHTASSH